MSCSLSVTELRKRWAALDPVDQTVQRLSLKRERSNEVACCYQISCHDCVFNNNCPGSHAEYYRLLKEVLRRQEQPTLFAND